MKWFDKWLYRKVRYMWENKHEYDEPQVNNKIHALKGAIGMLAVADVDSDEGLNITVRNAVGGKIVTFRRYDHKLDRNNHKLYVIPDDHDFEKELGKLITLESLR